MRKDLLLSSQNKLFFETTACLIVKYWTEGSLQRAWGCPERAPTEGNDVPLPRSSCQLDGLSPAMKVAATFFAPLHLMMRNFPTALEDNALIKYIFRAGVHDLNQGHYQNDQK